MKVHPAVWSLLLLLSAGVVAAAFYVQIPKETGTPDLSVPTTDGGTFELGAQGGTVVVLDIFNVVCESCVILENELKRVQPAWDPLEVRVVSLGAGIPNSMEELREYQATHELNWTVAQDTDDAMTKFGVIGFPTLVIVDPAGDIVFHRSGLASGEQIDRVVTEALHRERAPVAFARYSMWALPVVAAVASFFSPCAIGLLPGYVGHAVRFHGGTEGGRLRRAAGLGAVAASGLLLVFLGIGGLAFAFSQSISPYVPWLGPIVGVVLVLVGVLLLVRPYSVALQRFFSPLTAIGADAGPQRGTFGYFLYGLGYGAGSAGCTAPVLLSLIALATSAGPYEGLLMILLWAFSAAAFMAILTVVIAGGRAGLAEWLRRHAHKVEVASALLFVAAGVFLVWFAWRAGTL